MSTIIYAKRDMDGRIVALSRDPEDSGDSAWSLLSSDAPEVRDFIEDLAGEEEGPGNVLRDSDLSFIRVLEDVIQLLVERAIIRFTDLPLAAQGKLLQRRHHRQQQGLRLLGEEDSI